MSDSIPASKEVGIIFVLAILFGIYFVTLLFSFRWLFYTNEGWNLRPRRNINWTSVFSTTLIFVCNIIYLILSVRGTVAMVKYLSVNTSGNRFVDPPWEPIIKCTAACVAKLCADAFLTYRCWVVYGRRLPIIIFPAIMWFIGFICAILQIYIDGTHLTNPAITAHNWGPVNMTIGPGIVLIPFAASTGLVNIYATIMLIRRIYQVTKKREGIEVSSESARQFQRVIRMLAESGFLYLSTTIALFIAWFTPDVVTIQITSILNFPGLGIAFNLVIIRAAHQRAETMGVIRGNGNTSTKVSELVFGGRTNSMDHDLSRQASTGSISTQR